MTSDPSFDPRTWRDASAPLSPTPARQASPPAQAAPQASPEPGEPARAGLLGLALSVTILLAGAAAAYAMRPPAGAIEAAALSGGASANG